LIAQWASDLDSEPVGVDSGTDVQEYLAQVQAICRAHDRQDALTGGVPFEQFVRYETNVTTQIAMLPFPSEVTNVRRFLLDARKRMDRTAIWVTRVMTASDHPGRVYRQRLRQTVNRRAARLYQTFESYGVRCNTKTS
jgi:hypothetical protein